MEDAYSSGNNRKGEEDSSGKSLLFAAEQADELSWKLGEDGQ